MSKMIGLERKRRVIDLQHEREIAEGSLNYRGLNYRNELTSTGNAKSGGEYQTAIIYDSQRKIIGTASLFKRHDAPEIRVGAKIDPSIDEFIEAERIAEEYGLNVLLPESLNGIALIVKSGAYDLGNTGRGDIPLPGHIRREFNLGQRPSYQKSIGDFN